MTATDTSLEPCGTYGAYQRHKRRGETPCTPCRIANREYTRAYRAKSPEAADRDRTERVSAGCQSCGWTHVSGETNAGPVACQPGPRTSLNRKATS